jgi:hypothetical protein
VIRILSSNISLESARPKGMILCAGIMTEQDEMPKTHTSHRKSRTPPSNARVRTAEPTLLDDGNSS